MNDFPSDARALPALRAKRLQLFTQDEAIVLLRTDSPVCRSEGLAPRSRILLSTGAHEVVATLYQVDCDWLALDEAGLSEAVWKRLQVSAGDPVRAQHPPSVESLADVRRRVFGGRLDARAVDAIIRDIVDGRYADIHLATFVAACSAYPLDLAEITHLTRAMVESGERLSWDKPIVVDKHCVGGLPGNRTTPIIVAICASLGLTMPKTSSRAITSPAGTADVFETLAPVDLSLAQIREVVEAEGACIAWGGSVRLSPADDLLLRVERALDMDTEGQLIASVLSKKIAAGSTHVVIDLPVGPTTKIRSQENAASLQSNLNTVARTFGLHTRCIVTDGLQPVGRGIGPALEARDVIAVLTNAPAAPKDLRQRALTLAGAALEMAGLSTPGNGEALATAALDDGRAWAKLQRICQAQGGMRDPPRAAHTYTLPTAHSGFVTGMNNRKLSRLAKLAGAPDDKAAGIVMQVRLGDDVVAGQPLLTVHAETRGELDYALQYAAANADMIAIEV